MTGDQASLFDSPPLKGLAYAPALIGAAEEQALIAAIGGIELAPFSFRGWLGKRLTASFGWRYDFDNSTFLATDPIPEWLLPLRARAAGLSALPQDSLVQALVTRYDPGAGIGWHRDRPVFEHVIGISLGADAVLRLRRRSERGFDRISLPLAPRSAYHLSAEARHGWEHGIAPIDATRWSITFRSLASKR